MATLFSFTVTMLVAEVSLRLFWIPTYWVQCENWLFGSGETTAGRKWWPNSTYRVESNEFRVRFQTNSLGYRARQKPPWTATPYRVAFVGDSFTEAKQVAYDQTFVALLERGLAERAGGREVVCENYGVAGTAIFDYWHRITHDVFRPGAEPPAAVALCIYPTNDFVEFCPDDGFEPGGRPKREYYRGATWTQHFVTWLSLTSKLGYSIDYSLKCRGIGLRPHQHDAPELWWTNPASAAAAYHSPDVRQIDALLHAIEEECDRHGTRLAIVIVGPVQNYRVINGQSPLAEIFRSWGIKAPVIDVAAKANATVRPSRLVFPYDAHLNPAGHRYFADAAVEPLVQAFELGTPNSPSAMTRRDGQRRATTVR